MSALKPLLYATFSIALCLYTMTTESTDNTLTIRYTLRADPGDPESARTWTVTLGLQEVARNGQTIDWRVQTTRLRHYHPDGTVTEWLDDEPRLQTPQQLWRVHHDNPDQPQPAEFDALPNLKGQADGHPAGEGPLTYDVTGRPSTEEPPPFEGNVSLLTYKMRFSDDDDDDDDEPEEEEGEDEPAEVNPIDDPD